MLAHLPSPSTAFRQVPSSGSCSLEEGVVETPCNLAANARVTYEWGPTTYDAAGDPHRLETGGRDSGRWAHSATVDIERALGYGLLYSDYTYLSDRLEGAPTLLQLPDVMTLDDP